MSPLDMKYVFLGCSIDGLVPIQTENAIESSWKKFVVHSTEDIMNNTLFYILANSIFFKSYSS